MDCSSGGRPPSAPSSWISHVTNTGWSLRLTVVSIQNPRVMPSVINGSPRKDIAFLDFGIPTCSGIAMEFCKPSSMLRGELPPSLALPLKGGGDRPPQVVRAENRRHEIHALLAARASRQRR